MRSRCASQTTPSTPRSMARRRPRSFIGAMQAIRCAFGNRSRTWAITAEFLGGGKGFGELIRVAASQLQTPRVFSLILYLSVLGFLLFWSVVLIERKLVFWHRSSVTGIDDRR